MSLEKIIFFAKKILEIKELRDRCAYTESRSIIRLLSHINYIMYVYIYTYIARVHVHMYEFGGSRLCTFVRNDLRKSSTTRMAGQEGYRGCRWYHPSYRGNQPAHCRK